MITPIYPARRHAASGEPNGVHTGNTTGSLYPATREEVLSDILLSFGTSDFPRFAKYLTILHGEDRIAIPFHEGNWHPEQRAFERKRTGRDIVVKPRQIGFSTIECARDLFFALSKPNRNVLIVAYDDKLAKKLLQQIKDLYAGLSALSKRLGFPDTLFPPLSAKNSRFKLRNQALFIRFANGSSISADTAGAQEGKAANVGRGERWDRLHLTEVSRWSYATDVMNSLVPALPRSAEVILESTPNGVNDLFHRWYQSAKAGANGYTPHFFPWYGHTEYQIPLSPDELVQADTDIERELVTFGCLPEQLKFFRQKVVEFGGLERTLTEYPIDDVRCFVGSGGMFLSPEEVEYLEGTIAHPINRDWIEGVEVRIYENPTPRGEYVLGSDIATGGGGDDSTCVILNANTGALAALCASNRTVPHIFARLISTLGRRYNCAQIAVEEAAQGVAVIGCLSEENYPNLYNGAYSNAKGGWRNDRISRPIMIDNLKSWIAGKGTGALDDELVYQLTILAHDQKTGKVRAQGKSKHGKKPDDSPKDDLAMGYGIALLVRKESPPFHWETPLTVAPRSFGRGFVW